MEGNLIMLPPPTDLRWGISFPANRQIDDECEFVPGSMSWRWRPEHTGRNGSRDYRIRVMSGNGEKLAEFSGGAKLDFVNASTGLNEWLLFSSKELDSGRYYFAVQAVGDHIATADSGWAASELWTYEQPRMQLPPVAADWNDDASISVQLMNPDPQYLQYLRCFYVKVFVEESPGRVRGYFAMPLDSTLSSPQARIEVPPLKRLPPTVAGRKFVFKTCAVSNDITLCRNGPLTSFSRGKVFP